MLKKLAVPAVFAFVFVALAGQAFAAAANYSGTWKLNIAKSDFGPSPAPESMIRTIEHKDPLYHSTTRSKGPQGDTTTELNYTTDGKETVNKLPQGEAKGKAMWVDGKLVIDSVREVQGNELKFHEVYTLSSDGKVLTINNHVSVQGQELEITFVFDKQ